MTIGWDLQPPSVDATLAGRTLTWSSDDVGSPWLELRVALRRSGQKLVLDLGRRSRNGSFVLTAPVGSFDDATLRATNSAGYTTTVPLGPFPAPG